MDFYIDIGMAVMMRVLKERVNVTKYRSLFAKLYRAIDEVYNFSRLGTDVTDPTPKVK